MRSLLLSAVLLAGLAAAAPARAQHVDHAPSPYAGQQENPIKALSVDEVAGYLAGRGMGLAKAAELNHYPGPLHVLELADSLALTEEQRRTAEALRKQVRAEATALGARLVDAERRLDALFAGGTADADHLKTVLDEIGGLYAALRFVHLNAHVAMRAALSDAQVARYDALRGYGAAPNGGTHDHGGHH